MKKIGFIFISKTYCVYHSLSIAIALSKNESNDVHLLCTKENEELATQLLQKFKADKIRIKVLRPFWYFTIPHYLEIKFQLRPSLFYKYAKHFNTFDALVCTIYQDLELKTILGKKNKPKYVFTNHGIPNRAYSFDDKVLDFDLFFMLGDKEVQIRKSLKHLDAVNAQLTGFIKNDIVKDLKSPKFFKNDKPVVLYNPHWEKTFSSYYKFGERILDFFAQQQQYNFIFAPHALLLERNWAIKNKLKKYSSNSNMLIDLGSELSNDMSYTKSADIYLGDISSQVFEFLFTKKRPCIFFDAFNLNKDVKNKPLSWELGFVYQDVKNLAGKITDAIETHKSTYLGIQTNMLESMFHYGSSSPSEIAASAIENLLDKENI